MDFDLTQEQQMLKDSVSRYTKDAYNFESRRKIIESDTGVSPEVWSQISELGWLSIPFSQEQVGMGGSAVDLMVLMEGFGKGLVTEPFVSSALLFGGLLSQSNKNSAFTPLVERIISGDLHGSFAFLERQSRFEVFDIKTTATKKDDTFIINGEKTVVFNASNADKIIVLARTGGNQHDELGATLFLVDVNAEGIEKTTFRMMDGQQASNIKFNNVLVPVKDVVGHVDQAAILVKKVIDTAIVACSAEAVGIMEKLYTSTIEYSKIRKQFGVAIGSFQSLQHRMAEMYLEYEQAKSLLYRTVCSIDELDNDINKNILALKVMIGRAGQKICAEAIQIHGGMGVTDELDIGHYVKRLMMINTTFGDADYSQQKFSDLLLR